MQARTQSNRAPKPRGACQARPGRTASRMERGRLPPGGAEENLASRRFRALHPQQNLSPLQLRVRAKRNLTRTPLVINITNLFANTVANHRRIHVPKQIGRDEAAI